MYIYHFTNNKNIESAGYCGQCVNFKNRTQRHFSKHSHCKKFVNAINKYGKDAFDGEVIMEVPDQYANWFERYWIFQLGCVGYGYNLDEGGNTGGGVASPEVCHSSKSEQFVAIKCLENNKIYECQMDCARDLGIDQGGIAKCLDSNSGVLSYQGYHFCLPSDNITIEEIEACRKLNKYTKCIDDGKVFGSRKIAEQYYDIGAGQISKAIKRNGKVKRMTFIDITYEEYLSAIAAGNGG